MRETTRVDTSAADDADADTLDATNVGAGERQRGAARRGAARRLSTPRAGGDVDRAQSSAATNESVAADARPALVVHDEVSLARTCRFVFVRLVRLFLSLSLALSAARRCSWQVFVVQWSRSLLRIEWHANPGAETRRALTAAAVTTARRTVADMIADGAIAALVALQVTTRSSARSCV